MKNRQNGTLYIFIIILTSIQSTIIHTYSSTYTQIVFPILTRASLATQYNHSSNLSLNIAPEAKWIWCGADCKCHLFKLKCLSKNIYLHIAADNYYQAYINGIFIGSHYSQNNSSQTFNVSNIWCDNTFNLTIYAQNLNYWCQNFGGVIYAVVSEDCTHQKCPFMGLLQSNSLFYAIIAGICVGIVVFVIVLTTLICLCPINKRTKIIKQVNPPTSITQLNIISDICSICNHDKCDLITPCQHQFHLDCFIQAIQKNILCPNCQNKNIEIIKVIMCKKCQIYQHFEVLHKFFVPRVKLRQINMKHHFCNL